MFLKFWIGQWALKSDESELWNSLFPPFLSELMRPKVNSSETDNQAGKRAAFFKLSHIPLRYFGLKTSESRGAVVGLWLGWQEAAGQVKSRRRRWKWSCVKPQEFGLEATAVIKLYCYYPNQHNLTQFTTGTSSLILPIVVLLLILFVYQQKEVLCLDLRWRVYESKLLLGIRGISSNTSGEICILSHHCCFL